MNKLISISAIALSLLAATSATASETKYEVTVTNLTKSIFFTPVMVAAHRQSVELFDLGEPAPEAISRVAEGGDTSQLAAMFTGRRDQVLSAGPLPKGTSSTVVFEDISRRGKITVASMLLPTNDAFVAKSINLPRGYQTKTVFLKAYDAGTETNDELCSNIPGPQCGGAPFSPEDTGEGFTYVHSGIHGIGELNASEYTWNNPVLKVTIKRVNSYY